MTSARVDEVPVAPDGIALVGNRIAIIGCCGAGKSVLGRQMGERLGLPVFHLDRLNWKPGWVRTPRDEWRKLQEELVQEDRWIIEGNYSGTMDVRLAACDTVVYLGLSTARCLLRLYKRSILDYGKVREDLGPGCPETLPDWEFLKFTWSYRKEKEPVVLQRIEEAGVGRVFILRTPSEVRSFLDSLPSRPT